MSAEEEEEEQPHPKEGEMSTQADPAVGDPPMSQYSRLVEVLGHDIVAEIPETSRQAISEKLTSLLSKTPDQDSSKVAQLQSDNEDLRSALDDTRYELSNAQERLSAVNAERDEVIRLKEHLVSEVKSLGEKFSKREEEYKRVVSDREEAVSKLASVEASVCNLKILEDDLKSREEEVLKKESRISEEKDLMNIHLTSLSSELQETRSEFSKAKRDWQNENTRLRNELRSTTDSLSVCEAKLEVSGHEVKTLTDQLNCAKEIVMEKDATIVAYVNEIQAQKNLTQMHQDKNEYLSARLIDMERSITEYQELLLREQKRYIDLENLYDRDVSDQREELTKAHSTNQSLEKGLKEATLMVEDMRRKGLSDEVLAQLSPAAAAASKLLKPHMGLTEIYSELVTYKEKFFECESQKRNVEIQLTEVLRYVEGKTAGFKKLRQDLEHTLKLLDETKADFDKEKEDHIKTQEDLKRLQENYVESQNMNEAQENKALILGQQIRSLLSGRVSDTDGYDFHDYADLQRLNERLVGEISTLKQKLSQIKHDDGLVKLHYENESLMIQNRALSQEVNTLKAVCETLTGKADCFKSESEHLARRVTELESSADSSHVSNVVTPSDKRLEDAQQELQELKEEFDKYKEERQRNESILISQFEKTKETLLEARRSSVSIAQDLDSSAVLRMDFLKQEVRSFERTNDNLQTIIKSQEEALQSLHDHIITTESKLSTTTLKLSNAELELKRLQITAEKLSKMNEVLQNKRIQEKKIELCQVQLEGAEMINRIHLENKVTALEKENQDLKASIESHLENHKNEKSQWNDATLELKAELQKIVDSETKAKENLCSVQSELETVKDQLEMVRGSINPSQEVTGAKVTELQQQIRGLRNDVVSLQKQLTASRDELAKQKVAADNQERIFANSARSTQEKESKLEKTISELQEQCAILKKNSDDLTAERDGLVTQLKEHDVLDGLRAKEKLKIVQADLDLALTKVSSFNLTILNLNNELAQKTAKLEDCQASYYNEVVKKGEALKSVVELRKELQTMTQENTNLDGLLARTLMVVQEKGAYIESLENRFDNLNSSLNDHNESANLSNAGETSFGDSNILKGLQGDNNILASQLSVAKAQNQILQVEVDRLKKELDRAHQSTRDAVSNAPERKMEASKFKEIFDKAALVPGLSEVNLTLRATNERLLAENQYFAEKIRNAEEAAEKLKLMTTKFEETCQGMKQVEMENKDLKLKVQQYTDNARALKFDNLTKLKTEKEDLSKQLASIQAAVRSQKSEIIGLTSKLNIGETKLKEKESELQTMRISHNQIQIKLNNALRKCTEIEAAQKQAQTDKEAANTSDKLIITEKNARIESLISQLNGVKAYVKQLRTKLETMEQEKTDLNAKIKKLEESGSKKESQAAGLQDNPEASKLAEQSSQRISDMEADVAKWKGKYEKSQEQINRSKKLFENYKETIKEKDRLQEENETLKRKLGENVTPVGSSRSSPARSEWLSPSTSTGVPTGGLSPASVSKRPLSQDTDSAKRTRLETINESASEQPRGLPVPSVVVSDAASVEPGRAPAPEFDDADLVIGHRELNSTARLDRADNRTAVVPELTSSLSNDRFSSRELEMTGQYGVVEDSGDDRTVPGTPIYASDATRAVLPFPDQPFAFANFPPSSFVGGHNSQEQLSQGGLENTSIDILQLTHQPPPLFTSQNIPVIERRRIEPPPNPRPGYMGELGESSRPLYHDNHELGPRAAMSMQPNMRGAPRGPRVNRSSLLWTQQQASGPPMYPPHRPRNLRPRGFSSSPRNRGPPPS